MAEIPGIRSEPADPLHFGAPEELQRHQDERDEAERGLSLRARAVRAAALLVAAALLLAVYW